MTVLVTGGKGFIGYNLTKLLFNNGVDVTVIDNNSRISPSFKKIKKVRYITGDLSRQNLQILLADCKFDAVVHLASTVSVDECENSPITSTQNNITSTLNILDVCIQNGVKKLIFASTAAIYLKEKNVYANSKKVCEDLIKFFTKKTDIQTTVLRFFNVYGPGAHNSGPYAPVIEKFLDQKKKNNPLEVYLPGTQTRDFIHVQDICELILQILKSDKKIKYKVFDVCTGISIKIKKLAMLISKNIVIKGKRENEVIDSYSMNYKKTMTFFNWRPKQKLIDYINLRNNITR